MKKCSKCSHENQGTAKFCVQCGAKLERFCTQCGISVPAEARFCMGCGANVSDLAPASQSRDGANEVSSDDLYEQAVAIVLETHKASISYLQRQLSIGYNQAARLIETMEKNEIVSSMDSEGQREILVQEQNLSGASSEQKQSHDTDEARHTSSSNVRGTLICKWANLSSIESGNEVITDEEAISVFVNNYSNILEEVEQNMGNIEVNCVCASALVDNIIISSCSAGDITNGDRPSLKWVQIDFSCDLIGDVVENEETVKEDLRYGLIPFIKISSDMGWYKFQFADVEDADIQFSGSSIDSSDEHPYVDFSLAETNSLTNLSEWQVNLREAFHQRRSLYSSRSYFAIIFSKEGVSYEREVLGQYLLPNVKRVCAETPGPIDGFGPILTRELLEDSEGIFSVDQLRDLAPVQDVAEEVFPYLDGLFFANGDEMIFDEVPYDQNELVRFLRSSSENDLLQIVEYKPE